MGLDLYVRVIRGGSCVWRLLGSLASGSICASAWRYFARQGAAMNAQQRLKREHPAAQISLPERTSTIPDTPAAASPQQAPVPVERVEGGAQTADLEQSKPATHRLGTYSLLPSGDLPPSLQRVGSHVRIEPVLPDWRASGARVPLQRQPDLGQQIMDRLGRGTPLQPSVQKRVEGGLGANLSGVRVHTDNEADRLSRSVQATAFTTGSDIFFRSGAYNPSTPQGMHLLAHEATHTVQQTRGPVTGTSPADGVSVSDPGDRFERAAEVAAGRVSQGMSVQRTAAAGVSFTPESFTGPLPVQRNPPGGTTGTTSIWTWENAWSFVSPVLEKLAFPLLKTSSGFKKWWTSDPQAALGKDWTQLKDDLQSAKSYVEKFRLYARYTGVLLKDASDWANWVALLASLGAAIAPVSLAFTGSVMGWSKFFSEGFKFLADTVSKADKFFHVIQAWTRYYALLKVVGGEKFISLTSEVQRQKYNEYMDSYQASYGAERQREILGDFTGNVMGTGMDIVSNYVSPPEQSETANQSTLSWLWGGTKSVFKSVTGIGGSFDPQAGPSDPGTGGQFPMTREEFSSDMRNQAGGTLFDQSKDVMGNYVGMLVSDDDQRTEYKAAAPSLGKRKKAEWNRRHNRVPLDKLPKPTVASVVVLNLVLDVVKAIATPRDLLVGMLGNLNALNQWSTESLGMGSAWFDNSTQAWKEYFDGFLRTSEAVSNAVKGPGK